MEDLNKCSLERLELMLAHLYRWEWDELLGDEPKDPAARKEQRDAAIALAEERLGSRTANWLWCKYGLNMTFAEWSAWRAKEQRIRLELLSKPNIDAVDIIVGIVILIAVIVTILLILSWI